MRKNRFLILIALVLVCALLAVTVVGCQKTDNNTEGNGNTTTVPDNGSTGDNDNGTGDNTGNNDGNWSTGDGSGSTSDNGSTLQLSDVDSYITFDVNADSADDIQVTTATGGSVAVDIKSNNGVYTVWAPAGGYEKGHIYRITLSNGASFVKYDGVDVILFQIGNSANNIKINAGYLTYSEKAATFGEESTDGYGVTTGAMTLQTNSVSPMAAGTIFLIEMADGSQSAYKVTKATEAQAGIYLINYVKPDIDEVFEEFEYSATSKMTADSDVDFDYMGGKEALNNSELAMSIVEMFGSKPEFDISVPEFDQSGHVVVDITITIPNVVTVQEFGSANLVITVHNVMDVSASANIDKATLSEEFSLKATVKNDITTTVSLGANGGYTGAVNIPELMDKLVELANESRDDATAIPLFKWTVPIANGVASITYNADLMFRFSVGGEINAAAHAQLNYEVGVMYTEAYGLSAYANEIDENGFDSVQVNVAGQAELKIGLRQDLSFDILAGVLGIGIEAEIGNYNRLYGYGESSNLIDEADDYFAGGVYFEGGFYYDVNLSYGLKVGSILNLSGKVDIVDGEIKGYEAGERYLVLGVGAEYENYRLTALNTNVPAIYYKNMYDLVTRTRYTEAAVAEEFTFESAGKDLAIENYVLKVTKDIAPTVVTATYVADPDLSVEVKYSFSLEDPVLVNDTIVIDKTSYNNANATLEFGIKYNGFANAATTVTSDDVTVSVVDVDNTTYTATVSVPVKELLKLDNGMNEIGLTVGTKSVVLNLDVQGKVAWNQFATGANSYSVFTADQIENMVNSNASFDNAVITITDDIDMKGAELAPIAVFNGTLQGNGKSISNYTVKSFAGEKAGFVAVNNGTIDNVVFAGNVDVALEATVGKDYAVAGIAAVNNGTISNCAVTGDVNVYSYGLATIVEFDVAAVTAINNSNCDLTSNTGSSEGISNVKVTVKLDLVNVEVRVGDLTSTTKGIANVNIVTGCENCANGGPWATSIKEAK